MSKIEYISEAPDHNIPTTLTSKHLACFMYKILYIKADYLASKKLKAFLYMIDSVRGSTLFKQIGFTVPSLLTSFSQSLYVLV